MKRIPRILNCMAVRLIAVTGAKPAISSLDISVSDRSLENKIRQLAICQENNSSKFMLYFCDLKWRVLLTRHHSSLEQALEDAEYVCPSVRGKWLDPHDAARQEMQTQQIPYCAFCGKQYDAMSSLIKGQRAYICHGCIGRLYIEIQSKTREEEQNPGDFSPDFLHAG